MMEHVELTAFFVAAVLLVIVAAAVIVYVAYPHRGREPRHGRWATGAVRRIAEPVQVHDAGAAVALLSDRHRDDVMRERMRRVERVVTVGIAGSRD
jgi:hypothetical protein